MSKTPLTADDMKTVADTLCMAEHPLQMKEGKTVIDHQIQALIHAAWELATHQEKGLRIFETTNPDQKLCTITGCDKADGFKKICKRSELEQVAHSIYAQHPGEQGYYNFTKFLWVDINDGLGEQRLHELVPVPEDSAQMKRAG